MKALFIFFSLTFNALWIYCQEDEVDRVLKLPLYEVSSSRLYDFSAGLKVRKIDSLTLRQSKSLNLGELLQRSSAVHINAYAHNGLNTIAFRGTSVTHTGFYWNGFQLNPPNNGLIDLSLLPSALFNEIRVFHGGGSSLYGNGPIGGSIHLNNMVDFSEHLRVSAGLHMASFSQMGGTGEFSWSDGKWYSKTLVTGKIAGNDFPYTDLQGKEVRQKNGRLEQSGLMQDVYFNAGRGWVTGISLWIQENLKEIPATLTSKPSDASQRDRSLRAMLSARKYLTNSLLSIKSGILYDDLHYIDPDSIQSVEIDSEIKTIRSVTEARLEKKIKTSMLFNAGISYSAERGETGNYAEPVMQQQLGIFALWRQEFPGINWRMNINLRQDLVEHYQVPFTPAIGFEGKVYKIVSAKMSVSRSFRVPTFNDRYWQPGGNTELLPENSWNEEFSLIFDMRMEAIRNETRMVFTAYNSNVDNWILWVPDGFLWSARNQQKVWSRGLEAEYRSAFTAGKVVIGFIGGYTFARSTNQVKQGENDNSYKKQLIYVPMHRYFFTGNLLYSGFVLSYNQAREGERYTTTDNSEKLPGYTLGNVSLSKSLNIDGHLLDLSFETANVWNMQYQSVQYNPMPGRNYKFSIVFTLYRKQNEKNEN